VTQECYRCSIEFVKTDARCCWISNASCRRCGGLAAQVWMDDVQRRRRRRQVASLLVGWIVLVYLAYCGARPLLVCLTRSQ